MNADFGIQHFYYYFCKDNKTTTMSSLSNTTSDIHIQHPEQWCLELSLKEKELEYLFFSEAEENSLISGAIKFDESFDDYLKAVENAIYDNPVLLDDYKQVRIIVHSQHFLIFPHEVDDDSDAETFFDAAYPNTEGDFALCRLKDCGVNIGFKCATGLTGFLQRTFNNPDIVHHLYPLCEHFKAANNDSGIARMYLNMSDDSMDLLIFNKGALQLANTFSFHTPDDALFYALHAWKSYGLDATKDEIQLTGDKAARDTIAPMLRRFVSYVMPAIYPAAALKIGQDAVKAPFDLILLALCEL